MWVGGGFWVGWLVFIRELVSTVKPTHKDPEPWACPANGTWPILLELYFDPIKLIGIQDTGGIHLGYRTFHLFFRQHALSVLKITLQYYRWKLGLILTVPLVKSQIEKWTSLSSDITNASNKKLRSCWWATLVGGLSSFLSNVSCDKCQSCWT